MTAVRVKLMGGLGNQLFQYAAGRAVAQRHGCEVVLDVSGYRRGGLRRYELGAYHLPTRTTSSASLLRRIFSKPAKNDLYREPHFHFDPALGKCPPPVCLEGYWQSEKYFSDISSALREEIRPREMLAGENLKIATAIKASNAVSLHVRRGDYVSNPQTQAYHGTCGLDYYRKAAAMMAERADNPHFFVFSDDPVWTQENLALPHEMTFVTANGAGGGHLDLELMRRCKHHIIANSSFSWWGAWLNPSPDKTVIAPAQWFANSEHNTRDLIPQDWVRL